jgi:hypothetical protein
MEKAFRCCVLGFGGDASTGEQELLQHFNEPNSHRCIQLQHSSPKRSTLASSRYSIPFAFNQTRVSIFALRSPPHTPALVQSSDLLLHASATSLEPGTHGKVPRGKLYGE